MRHESPRIRSTLHGNAKLLISIKNALFVYNFLHYKQRFVILCPKEATSSSSQQPRDTDFRSRRKTYYLRRFIYTTVLEKNPTFFCENLLDFNKARLHEATLNPHTHA